MAKKKDTNFDFTINPFQLAMEGFKVGLGSLTSSYQTKTQRKSALMNIQREMGEGQIKLGQAARSQAAATGFTPQKYSGFLEASRRAGEGQLKYQSLLGEYEDRPFIKFANPFAKDKYLFGGRRTTSITQDLLKTQSDIRKYI